MSTDPDDQIARMRSEMKEGKWMKNASRRAQRRKSAWNLLLPALMLPLWLGFIFIGMHAAAWLHLALHPYGAGDFARFWRGGQEGPRLMILIPLLIATIVPAMMLTNFLVARIPPARRAMEKEDRGHRGVDYASSQRALFKVGVVIALVAAIPFVAGVWLS